jgi:outer membrane protein assembly factor BamB
MKKLTLSLSVLICLLISLSVQAQVGQDQARNFQINETHTGSSSSPGLIPPLKQKWSVNFGWPISYPLIADGKVFVTVKNAPVTSGTTLFALNAGDGSMLWSINLNLGGPNFWSALCYENGRVFVLTREGRLAAFDGSTGSVIWSQQLPGQFSFTSPPTVFQGVVYAGGTGNGGTAYAVSADNGNVLWAVPLANAGSSSPAVTTEGVYLSYLCINVYKLNPANGSQIWRDYVACGSGSGRVPVLYNNRLYVRSPGSNTDWIYDSQTGGIFDTFMSKSAPAFSGNMGFFLNGPRTFGTYGTLEGRNVNSNLVYWSFTGDGALQSSVLVVNDYVYVGSNTGKLFAVEAATGHQVWSTTAGTSIPYVDEVNSSQPITGFAAGEGILVVPTSTTLVAYESDNSPTITWDSPIPAPNSFGWNNTPVQLPFTPVAHPSGSAFANPESPLQFNSEGANQTQQVSVSDQVGNTATLTSPVVKIDMTSPTTTSAVSGTVVPGVTTWYQNSAQVTLTRADNLSGIRGTSYTIDGGTTQNYSSPFVIQTDGSHTVNFWSFDFASNNETQQSIAVNVDVNAPSTQISAGSGFYASPAEVTLTATDSGSGVANTFYRIDSGDVQTYSAPFMVSGDSNRQIVYWSVDQAGHTESQHFFTLKLDGSAPTTNISTTGTNGWNGWKTSPVQVTLSPSDSRSGVAATYYTVDGGPTQPYSGPFMINESAAHQVNYWSVDNVGNTETQKSAPVNIDKDAPVTESSVSGPAGNNNYYRGAVQVTLTASDSVSGLGVQPTTYQVDSETVKTYMGSPFTVSGDGSHTVRFWSTDFAGNTASPNTITINIDATAPVTQAALSGTAGPFGWYTTAVQVTLTATDNVSGVGSSYYAVDGGLQQTYSGPFTISTTGTHTVLYWSQDVANNVEAQHPIIFKIDVGSPSTTASVSGTSINGWYQAPAQVTLTASDDASGVGNTFYTIDGGATQTYASPFNISDGGIHSIDYWSVDAVGNIEHQQSLTVQVDVTAPTTVISSSGTDGNNGWYTSSAMVTLTASDNNQAGVATTYYSIEGGATQEYTAPFTLSNSGYYTIIYWSTDAVGNTESHHSILIKVDVDAPSSQAQIQGSWYDVWYQSPVQVYINSSDGGSGTANTYYTLDGGATQTYTGVVNISTGGVHTFNYWTVDQAGNTETQKSLTVRVDNTAPTTQLSPSGTAGANGWYRSAVQVSLNASDSQVGVGFTMYRVDGGPTMVYSSPFTVSGDGLHQVIYYSNDKLSNTETQQTATIKIDSTVPTAQNSISGAAGGNGFFKGAVLFSMTASDNLSGVANNYYRIDGGATLNYSSPVSISSDGNHAVDYWSVDAAGNVSAVGTVPFKIDASAPLTLASGSGTAGTNGWYRSAVLVSLAASDNLSGVQTTFYKIDGGTTKTYTAAFSVSGNGSHAINFWSVDKATNTENTQSVAINIDSNTPGVTASVNPASAAKSANPVTITVSGHATDTVSGVATSGAVNFSVLDEYGVAQPSGPVTLQTNGNYSFTLTLPATKNVGDNSHLYTITVVGTDRAGNTNSASDTLKIN